jgi:hypothetical protein
VTIEKFETNLVLVNVNKFKPYKYMESEVQKQEQHMLVYWEQSAAGIQVEILIRRRKMNIVKYRNHRCEIQEMNNRWKILR